MANAAPAATPVPPSRWRRGVWAIFGTIVLLALAAGLIRYGPATQFGRNLITRELNGLELGALGRLKVEGLGGDPWDDPSLDRLTLADSHGVWLDARGLTIRWRPAQLLARRLDIVQARASVIRLLRRPTLPTNASAGGRAPVSVRVEWGHARVEMTPQFAARAGAYDVAGHADVERSGVAQAQVRALSLLHAGDHLFAGFDVGRNHAFQLGLDAREAQGGALAGALGFAADKPFMATANAAGSMAAGQALVDTSVGEVRPVQFRARWNRSGGEAHGEIDLTASSLLARLRDMVGPSAHFDIAGRKAPDGLYAFRLSSLAENAQILAQGEADVGHMTTGPAGLQIAVRVGQANRLLRFPKMGAASLTGTLTGDRHHWRLVGVADAEQVTEGGYALAKVSGPVTLENRGSDLIVTGQPAGTGGAGRGLLAALLGANPRGQLELTRLADGRMLMRHLSLQAVGLEANATGAMGLLGDLKFSGSARMSNLAFAHTGATGVVTMDWTASQAGRSPWTFGADAHGQNFGSGLPEADRLLGRTPRLVAQASWVDGKIRLASSDLTGSAGEVKGTGDLGGDGSLALKLDWQARGPFVIGPMEIAGVVKGAGDLAGTWSSPRADLVANLGSVATPLMPLRDGRLNLTFQRSESGADGKFALAATSDYGPAQVASAFRFVPAGIDLADLSFSGGGVAAKGSLALRKGEPSSADLVLTAGPGVLLTQGHAEGRLKIEGATAGAQVSLSLRAGEAVLRDNGLAIKDLDLTAAGPLSRLPYRLTANGPSAGGPWRVRGDGDVSEEAGDRLVSFTGSGRMRRAEFRTLAPAEIRMGPKGLSAHGALAAGGGRADLKLNLLDGAAYVAAKLDDIDMSLLNEDYVGKVSGQLTLAGKGEQLAGDLDAHLIGAGGRDMRGAPPVNGEVNARLASRVMNLDFHLGNSQGLKALGQVRIPAEGSAAPFRIAFDKQGPLRGQFSIDGEIKPLWDLVIGRGGADSLAGQVNANMTLGGTLSDPKAVGQVSLDRGRLQDLDTGFRLENVSLRASLAGAAVDVTQFNGSDGGKGQIAGSGQASLQRDGVSSFRAQLTGFRLIDTDLAQATASGTMSVNRAADGKVKLIGALVIDKAQISPNPPVASGVTPMDVVEINRADDLDDQPSPAAGGAAREAPVALDVAIKTPGGVFLKGRGLNLELALDSHVGGTVANPLLTGTARVVRGDYDFAGQRFQLDDRSVIYLGSTAQTIRLNLIATREDPTLTAVIKISGVAAKPSISLSSSPALPQDEILSQVLFGASASQLSGLEAAQLASAVAGLSGGGGFDLIGGLRSLAHLDRLAIADSAVNGTSISGGKYINEKLYLQLTGGGRIGQGAQLEWRVRKHVSLVGKLGNYGDSQLAIRWRRSY